jgi:(R,R)-butanediol dehydrogenase / meso-butanediol dehydrogenase / diacetyl reductase
MRAALYHGPGDVRVAEIAEPEVGVDQVLIKVELCGICGTDLHEFYDGPVFCPTATAPHPLTGATAPVVLGHELVGVIERLGEEAPGLRVGERVVVEPRQTCGHCTACSSGQYNCCPQAATIGLQGGGGGLAERIVVDASLVFSIGDLPAEIGVVVEPLAVALHAVRRTQMPVRGARTLVFGAGPIGLLIAWVLKVEGADSVTVVEPSQTRRSRSNAFGADLAIDPATQDVAAVIRSATSGAGVDVAFECAGKDVALAGCLDAVRPGGAVVNVAIAGKPLTVDLLPLILKEVRLLGTICYANDHQAVIDLLNQHPFPVELFITGRIALEDLVDEGIRRLAEEPEQHVKIVVAP